MSLSIGIIGLPNVGKSTTFNALTRTQQAQAANYPFTTIEPNRAVVPVPDPRLDQLAALLGRQQIIHATITFVDIAGLVAGASRGEGLGNQFLGQIRDVDALIHVVRCFDDPNVVHIRERPSPRADIEIINTELILADLQQLERKIERLDRQVKGDRQAQPLLELAHQLQDHLERGRPVALFPDPATELFDQFRREMRFLTGKPVIYVANVAEEELASPSDYLAEVEAVAAEQEAEVVTLCAQLEAEMAGLSDAEQQEYLALLGVEASGLDQVIRRSYRRLGLISFFTFNEREVRAWTIRQGQTAPQAAGTIHTDFERGFIRAEVVPHATFMAHGSETAVKAAGAMRSEGREYVVQDGDVIYFRFNV